MKKIIEFMARFVFAVFTAMVFLMLTVAVAFSQTKDAQAKISMGDTYAQQGNGGKALSSYEDAAALDPKNHTPWYKIGIVYVRSKNNDAAIESFKKVVSIDPNYAEAYKELGELYYTMKNGAEAVKAQENYMELKGFPDEGLVRLGYYLFMARDFVKTIEIFEQAYQKGLLKETGLQYYAKSLAEYGKVLLESKQDSTALTVLQKSYDLDSRDLNVKKMLWERLYSLGKSYYQQQRYEAADSTFEKLISLHPGIITGYLWAGRANAGLDPESEKGLAKDFYEKVIEIGQTAPEKSKNDLKEAYSYLGYYYLVKKDNTLSRENWEKVLSIDPQNENAQKALKTIKK